MLLSTGQKNGFAHRVSLLGNISFTCMWRTPTLMSSHSISLQTLVSFEHSLPRRSCRSFCASRLKDMKIWQERLPGYCLLSITLYMLDLYNYYITGVQLFVHLLSAIFHDSNSSQQLCRACFSVPTGRSQEWEPIDCVSSVFVSVHPGLSWKCNNIIVAVVRGQ